MLHATSDNIITPLAATTSDNLHALRSGATALRTYEGPWGLPEQYTLSLFTEEQRRSLTVGGLTFFQSLVLTSALSAMSDANIDPSEAVFILSSTKGDIDSILSDANADTQHTLANTANLIAARLGIPRAIVVSNACISGLSAVILAGRLIEGRLCKHAVVTGCDTIGSFIASGFNSLKALSPVLCRPFDIDRLGLNLGEAAATVVLTSSPTEAKRSLWTLDEGYVRGDANHISQPSSSAEGLVRALRLVDTRDLAVVNLHGTATMYNDHMESQALRQANLLSTPVNALKGTYGHTLGASGVLELILSMRALQGGVVLPTHGYAERGVSAHVDIVTTERATTSRSLVKTLSGFGGTNAVVRCSLPPNNEKSEDTKASAPVPAKLKTLHRVQITNSVVTVDGQTLPTTETGAALLLQLYNSRIADYPKFYKMDPLSRLGFVATELLLQSEGGERFTPREDRAVLLFNSHSSLLTDRKYRETIGAEDYYPSPALFVYTLPNIVCGEIAIRNKYHGETAFYLLQHKDFEEITDIASVALDRKTSTAIVGWIACEGEMTADVRLMTR